MTSRARRVSDEPTAGPARSVLAVAALAVLVNGGLALIGGDSRGVEQHFSSVFAPPGWLVGGVWIVLFGLLGLARWRLARSGSEAGRQGARWAMAFVVVCALYPVYTLGLRSLTAGFVGNVGTALFAVFVGLQVMRIDSLSAGVFALVVAWLCYATFAIAAQLGWLPVWVTQP